MIKHNMKTTALARAFIAVFFWAMVPVFLRYLLAPPEKDGLGLDLWIVNAIRYSIGALFWTPMLILKTKAPRLDPENSGRPRLSDNIWLAAIVPAAVNLVGQIGWGATPRFLPASVTAFGVRSSFIVTIAAGLILFPDERGLAGRMEFRLGVVAAVFGLALMSWESLAGGVSGDVKGFGILLITILFWGCYAVSIKKFMSNFRSTASFGVISLYTAAGLIVCAVLFGDGSMFGVMNSRAWVILIVSGMVGVVVPHVLFYSAIKRLGALIPASVQITTPFITMLISIAVLKEDISGLQLMGGSVIVCGCAALILAKARMDRENAQQE